MAGEGKAWQCKFGNYEQPGVSAHTGPSAISETPSLLLNFQNVTCAPLVDAEGRVFITEGKTPLAKGLWIIEPNLEQTRIPVEGIIGTPAIAEGKIFVCVESGTCLCLDIAARKEVWRSKFTGSCGTDNWALAANSKVVIVQGYINEPLDWTVLPPSDHIFALDAKSGKVKWKFKPAAFFNNCAPCIAGSDLVFNDIVGGVYCLKLADGTAKWTVKGAGSMISRCYGGCIAWNNMVYLALNLKSKKAPNAPCGGKGAVHAFDLKTGEQKWDCPFDLEAHACPIVVPKGPGGKPAVVVGLGAQVVTGAGDTWPGRVVALGAADGRQLWAFEPETHRGSFVAGAGMMKPWRAGPWSMASCGADGTIYIGCHAGDLFLLDSATGEKKLSYAWGSAITGAPGIGPGMLVITSSCGCGIWHATPPEKETFYSVLYVEPLERPFSESGTQHFNPCRQGTNVERPYVKESPAGIDLSKPTWCWNFQERKDGDVNNGSIMVDAQRNIWAGWNAGMMVCLRPDGTPRASGFFHHGLNVFNPALHGGNIIASTTLGFLTCVSMETLEIVWKKRFWTRAGGSGLGFSVHEDTLLALGTCRFGGGDGEDTLLSINAKDGSLNWRYDMEKLVCETYNSFPGIATLPDGRKVVVLGDLAGGMYAIHLDDGTPYVVVHKEFGFTTAGPTVGPGGAVYVCHNQGTGEQGQCYAYDLAAKAEKWTYSMTRPYACAQPATQVPTVIPKELTEDKATDLVLVPIGQVVCGNPSDREAMIKNGGLFRGELVALNAETGKPKWTFEPPPLRSAYPAGCSDADTTPPDTWSAMITDSKGVLYTYFQSGYVFAINVSNGQELSRYFIGSCANGGPAICPGMVVFGAFDRVVCWRDAEAEEKWRTENSSDPRASVPWPALKAPEAKAEGGPNPPRHTMMCDYDLPFPTVGQELRAATAVWKVVGGGSAGGIVVRKGEGLKTAELPRLSTGALIKEIEKKGDRLHYEKLSGDGPNSGWVSLSFKGTPLVQKQ